MPVRYYLSRYEESVHPQLNATMRFPAAWKYSSDGEGSGIQVISLLANATWCLVRLNVSDTKHAECTADPLVVAVPARAADTALSALTSQQRNALRNRLNQLGLSGDMDTSTTLRQLLDKLGKRLASDFSLSGTWRD
jgi:hypothetical protein